MVPRFLSLRIDHYYKRIRFETSYGLLRSLTKWHTKGRSRFEASWSSRRRNLCSSKKRHFWKTSLLLSQLSFMRHGPSFCWYRYEERYKLLDKVTTARFNVDIEIKACLNTVTGSCRVDGLRSRILFSRRRSMLWPSLGLHTHQ